MLTLAADVGGTFTDLVLVDAARGRVLVDKVPSGARGRAAAIAPGIERICRTAGIAPSDLALFVHGFTVPTNAFLMRSGARVALVTTRGAGDVLEIGNQLRPKTYALMQTKPKPVVERTHVVEVDERVDAFGGIVEPLTDREIGRVVKQVCLLEPEAVAISLHFSFLAPRHEEKLAAALERALPGIQVYASHVVNPQLEEWPRASTTAMAAYVGPVVARYLGALGRRISDLGVDAPLRVMQSNGGVMTASAAAEKPASIVESGPAAGVIACARIARRIGWPNVISFDMGGTTAKAAIIENGEPARTSEYEVGAGINLSSKLVKGGGYAIKLPFIDVSEIGAGGGSIVAIDAVGSLRVGPRSAGAVPGPACYDLGGVDPTFTDAAVVLGYLNDKALVGGQMPIVAELSRRMLADKVATPLGLEPRAAAFGVFSLAVAGMTRAVKAVSTYRGRDPRDFALVAFGGNGPVVAAAIAAELNMRQVLVPPAPGVFSALGLVFSDIEHDAMRTIFRRLGAVTAAELGAIRAALEADVRAAFAAEGAEANAVAIRVEADLRYSGQAYELTIPLAGADLPALAEAFHAEHARTYGHRQDGAPIDLINLRVIASAPQRGESEHGAVTMRAADLDRASGGGARECYFGARYGVLQTPVIARGDLRRGPVAGPAIVEEFDATCVVPPDCTARLDEQANIIITVPEARA